MALDLSKFKQGDKYPANWKFIGMANKAIKNSKWNNAGKWNVFCLGHPTSGSGNIACTEDELDILAGKLGLSSGLSLQEALSEGIVEVSTSGIVNKAKSKYQDHITGETKSYDKDHVRFNVNDYVLTPDANVEAFVKAQKAKSVERKEAEASNKAQESAKTARMNAIREAQGLSTKVKVEEEL